MAYFDVSNPEYNEQLRKLETTDPNHADTFNAALRQLIQNDEYIKKKVEQALENSKDAETVNGHTVESDVPLNAKFTDTIYTHPTTPGNKHIPGGGASGQVLKYSADGAAAWGTDNDTIYTHPSTHPPTILANGTLPAGVVATNSTDYTTSRLRNMQASTTDLTAGSSSLENGAIYLVYE